MNGEDTSFFIVSVKPAVHEHQRTDTYFILARERTKFNGQVVLAGRFKKLPYLVLSVEAARWMIYAYFSDCSSNSNAPSLSQWFLACIYSCSFWEIVISMRRTATYSKDRCPELKKMTTPTGPRRCASVQKRVKIYAVGPAAECLIDEGRWPFRLQKFALDNGILRSGNFCELARANYSSASSDSFFVAKNIPRFIIRSLDYELDEWDAGDDIPELRDSTYDVREADAAVECSIGSCCDCAHAHKRQKILLKPLAVDSLELWVREFHGTVVRSVFYDAIKIEPALFRKWLLAVLSHGYPIFVKILSFCGFAIYDGDMKSEKIIWCLLVHFWTSGFKSRISTWIWTWSSSSSRDSGLEFPR